MHDVAAASLPVAIGLLVLAAWARAVLWAQVDREPARRVATAYLGPLSVWCLIAAATNALAVGASGDAGVASLAVPLGLGVAAVVLRASVGEEPDAPAPVEPDERPAAPAPASAHPPAVADTRPPGLWSRG
jgi:hypothetical protein